MIQTATLSNGVSLLLDHVPGAAVASLGYWFRIGSRDEQGGQEGYAHLLEHMLFKGTRRRTARDIALDVDRVGGFLNAFTEKEVTCYHCTVPREALPLAVDVLTDMIRHSVLDPVELAKEKNVIVSEINAAEDVAEEVAHDLYLDGLFPGHPVARRITGKAAEVRAVTAEGLRAFHCGRYGASTMTVGIAGDVSLEEALTRIEGAFDGWEAAGEAPAREPPFPSRCWSFRRGRSEQLHFYTGVATAGAQTLREYYATLVFSTLAGESMSSRLFQSLRENHALCYAVTSFRTQLSDVFLWTIYASTTPKDGMRFLRHLQEELGRLKREPPDETEVADAKSHLRGSLILAQEDTETRMKRMVRQSLLVGKALEYEESLREIDNVTSSDVARVAMVTMEAERLNLMVYGGRGVGRLRGFRYEF